MAESSDSDHAGVPARQAAFVVPMSVASMVDGWESLAQALKDSEILPGEFQALMAFRLGYAFHAGIVAASKVDPRSPACGRCGGQTTRRRVIVECFACDGWNEVGEVR